MMSRPVVLAFLAFLVPALAGGCHVGFVASTDNAEATVSNPYQPDASDAGGYGAPDEPGPMPPTTQGSPLCNASVAGGCYPDDPTTAKDCPLGADGAAYSPPPGFYDVPPGCHVVPSDASTVQPMCLPGGLGIDGTPCSEPTNCATMHECVGPQSASTCRHYCCRGNIECRAEEFCDIQPTAQSPGTQVPVCMPTSPCLLLGMPNPCPAGETCAVVREDGATSCVAVGAANAGDPCDTDHCATGLVCIGAVGGRRCYQLCHTLVQTIPRDCPMTMTCIGGLPLFPDASVGICQMTPDAGR